MGFVCVVAIVLIVTLFVYALARAGKRNEDYTEKLRRDAYAVAKIEASIKDAILDYGEFGWCYIESDAVLLEVVDRLRIIGEEPETEWNVVCSKWKVKKP